MAVGTVITVPDISHYFGTWNRIGLSIRYISLISFKHVAIQAPADPVNPCPGVHHRILTTPLHSIDHPAALHPPRAPAPRTAHRTATGPAPTRATDVAPTVIDPVLVQRRATDRVRGTGGIPLPVGTGISGIRGSTIIALGTTIDERKVDDLSEGR